MNLLEDNVISLFEAARRNVLVVAPFMRSESLKRLLDSIPMGIETTTVTRWRIEDLIAGASDLGVYELAERRNIPLYLRSDLHAKLFAADDKCLVGSANVTNAALGSGRDANLELLVPVSRMTDTVVKFEKQLMTQTIRATVMHRDRLSELLSKLQPSVRSPVGMEGGAERLLALDWVPQVRNPEELYSVHSGNADMSRTAGAIMQEELTKLGVAEGLDAEEFNAWVGIKISQSLLVGRVIQTIEEVGEVTEADISELLGQMGVQSDVHQPREVLEVLERWLSCFLFVGYETARDSVKLIKARML